jgi:hypothetical protein
MEESRKWEKEGESPAKRFLREKVFQDNLVTPFFSSQRQPMQPNLSVSSISRHLVDGNRTFTDTEDIKQQTSDREFFIYITKRYIIRPERGDTNVSIREEGGVIYYQSSFTRVIKDIIRGHPIDNSILDYHTAQRFAAPLMVGGILIYAHFEPIPLNLLDENDKVVNPRVRITIKGASRPYSVDGRFVATIGWPDRKEAPFLDKILGASPYPEGTIVNGRIPWKDFIQNELFSDILQKLKIDVMNEKPEKHPTIELGSFFTKLNLEDCVLPYSPVDNYLLDFPPLAL